ncbi:MAG TPA: hypothetical protein VF895_10305 [Gaiellaceae bacterium]
MRLGFDGISRWWLAAGALGFALFTLVCMLLAMRLAGPVTHSYNLGTLEYEIEPSFSGKAQIYVPLADWELEAPLYGAPYVLHIEPREVSPTAIVRAAKGFKPALKQAKKDIKHSAIWTFVRAFMFGLLGGLAAALLVLLFLRAIGRAWRTSMVVGAGCFVLATLLVAGSGLWLWQSLDLNAFHDITITNGRGAKAMVDARRQLRHDNDLPAILQDLSRLVARGDRIKIKVKTR